MSSQTSKEAPSVPAGLRALARRSLWLNDAALAAECDLEVFIASGPGGQHRNKTESGVRLHHRPTGITAAATERRSQLQNRGAALARLRHRLEALSFEPKPRRPTRPSKASKERRLDSKRKLAGKKSDRRRDDW
jgi:protein subunit release factor B